MDLRIDDVTLGPVTLDFALSPGGWVIGAFGRDPLYVADSNLSLLTTMAAARQDRRAQHFRPLWVIDRVGNLMHFDVAVDAPRYEGYNRIAARMVLAVDREYNLGLGNIVEKALCTLGTRTGLISPPSYASELSGSALIQFS